MASKSTSREWPGFEKLHLFDVTGPGTHFFAQPLVQNEEDAFHLKGVLKPNSQVRYVQFEEKGYKTFDVIPTTQWSVLISDRVVRLLEENGITGWDTYSVQIEFLNGKELPGYKGLVITGRCGSFDQSLSKIVNLDFGGGPMRNLKGFYFEPATWDGSDFFMPSDQTLFKICTDRVRRLFKREKVGNSYFQSLSEALWPGTLDD